MRTDGRLRRRAGWLIDAGRTWPFTLSFTAAVTIIGVLSGTAWRDRHADLKAAIGTDLDVLLRLRLYRFVVSPFYQSNPGVGWSMVLMLLLFVGALEYATGTRRAAATFFVADFAGSAGGIVLLAVLGEIGWGYAHHAARTPDCGSSIGMFGCAAAVGALLPGRWRWLALGPLYGFLLPSFLWFSFATWAQHLINVSAAAGLAALAWRRGAVRMPPLVEPGRRVV